MNIFSLANIYVLTGYINDRISLTNIECCSGFVSVMVSVSVIICPNLFVSYRQIRNYKSGNTVNDFFTVDCTINIEGNVSECIRHYSAICISDCNIEVFAIPYFNVMGINGYSSICRNDPEYCIS